MAIAAVTSTTVTGNSLQCKAGAVTVACPSTTSLSDGQQITLSASSTASTTSATPIVLLGDQTIEATSDGSSAPAVEAFGFTASASGTATSASVYLTSTDGATVGLYTDSSGKPGKLLDKGSIASNTAGWSTVPLSGGVQVASGTRYWIAVGGNSGGNVTYRDHGTSGSTLDWGGTGFADPYSATGQYNSNPISAYVSGTTPSTTTTTSTTSTTPTTTTTTTTTPPTLPHDPSFVGPGYYSKWSNGPSTSTSFFPLYQYQIGCITCWSGLGAAVKGMGINGLDNEYDGGGQSAADFAAANGLTQQVNESLSALSGNKSTVTAYTMQDEPNSVGDVYSPASCPNSPPPNDTCAQRYVTDANAYRTADSTRPVFGTLGGGEVNDWNEPCDGNWTVDQCHQHFSTELKALDITAADGYWWTDPYQVNDTQMSDTTCKNGYTTHCGAWAYGKIQDSLRSYNPGAPSYGFVECCGPNNFDTSNETDLTPGMLKAAVWDMIAHRARGIIYWTTDFWDVNNGDPNDCPASGASYYSDFALYADCQWSAQYQAAKQVNGEIKADAVDLNSPTVSGISATSSDGTPVATLGKDVGSTGKLWLLAMADGSSTEEMSNQSSITATITLPSSVPAGTVLNVAGENRTVTVDSSHQFTDTFGTETDSMRYCGSSPYHSCTVTFGYQRHIYSAQ